MDSSNITTAAAKLARVLSGDVDANPARLTGGNSGATATHATTERKVFPRRNSNADSNTDSSKGPAPSGEIRSCARLI